METVVWFTEDCSKCRAVRDLLEERGVTARYREYLKEPPTVPELEHLADLLPARDAIELVRLKEPLAAELGLVDADRATRIAQIAAHPELLNRPIVVHGGKAVVARPPEAVIEVL